MEYSISYHHLQSLFQCTATHIHGVNFKYTGRQSKDILKGVKVYYDELLKSQPVSFETPACNYLQSHMSAYLEATSTFPHRRFGTATSPHRNQTPFPCVTNPYISYYTKIKVSTSHSATSPQGTNFLLTSLKHCFKIDNYLTVKTRCLIIDATAI